MKNVDLLKDGLVVSAELIEYEPSDIFVSPIGAKKVVCVTVNIPGRGEFWMQHTVEGE